MYLYKFNFIIIIIYMKVKHKKSRLKCLKDLQVMIFLLVFIMVVSIIFYTYIRLSHQISTTYKNDFWLSHIDPRWIIHQKPKDSFCSVFVHKLR